MPHTIVNHCSPAKATAYTESSIMVQGGSLRTWSYRNPAVDQVQVVAYLHEWDPASRDSAGDFVHWAMPMREVVKPEPEA